MESETSDYQLKNVEVVHQETLKKLNEKCFIVEATDEVKVSQPSMMPANTGVSLGPNTPDLSKESGDFSLVSCSSPTLVSLPPKTVHFDSHRNQDQFLSTEDPCTPKEDVFDPFAPGPDKFMLAPICKKYLEESRSNVARCLNFSSAVKFSECGSDCETFPDEERLLEAIYCNLLDAIISTEAEKYLVEISAMDLAPDGFKTPTSAPLLNGIAETCPGAPMKATIKLRNIDKGLCRKLEF